MRKPDFFVVGAAKAGTTSLFNYMIQHPSIFAPAIKEPQYFSDYFHAGVPELSTMDDYLRLFEDCKPDQRAGDFSTSYLYSPNAARRIHELQPNAKIIVVLRNPIDRAYSFYWFNRNQFVESLSFEEALDREAERIAIGWRPPSAQARSRKQARAANSPEPGAARYHYTESGRYYAQVNRYFAVFSPASVKVYLFEDLIRDPVAICREIFDFLGVAPDQEIRTDQVFNRGGVHRSGVLAHAVMWRFPGRAWLRRLAPILTRRLKHRVIEYNMERPPSMEPATRERLRAILRPDIEQLSELLNRDLSHWLAAPRQRVTAHAGMTPDGT